MSDVSMPDGPNSVYLDRYTADDSDSLSYDNETVRYDYDVIKSGEHEDVSGQGGAGYTTEDTDVYVSGHFDEATGNVGGRIELGHAINPDTFLDAHFAADHEDNTSGHVGLTHHLSDEEVARVEIGTDSEEGDYLDLNYERMGESGSDALDFHGSENGGSSVTYNGTRNGEDWDLGATFSANDEGETTGTVQGEKHFEINENTDARVYGEANLDGSWKAGAEATHLTEDGHAVAQGIEIDDKGNADGFVSHAFENNHERVGLHVTPGGDESLSYVGHHEGDNWNTDESFTVDKDGKVEGQVAGNYEDAVSENRTRVFDGTVRSDGSWEVGVNQADAVSDNVSLNNELRYDSNGKVAGNHNVLVTTLNGQGYVSGDAGWDSEGGRSAGLAGGYGFENGSTVDANVGWDGHHYSGGANAGVVISDTTSLNGGLTYDGVSKSTGVNVGMGYTSLDNRTSVGAGIGYSANPDMEHGSIGTNMNFADALGAGSSVGIGLSAEEDIYRKKEAVSHDPLTAELRTKALVTAGEDSSFVEYGARRKLAADFGTSFSIGSGYVEAGLSAGEEYELRFVKLADKSNIGETPSETEMKVPDTALGVLDMKPGESFSVTGGSHQGIRGGGGLGFSSGAVGVSAGLEAGLMVSGRLSTEVLRGSEGSARLVLSKADGATANAGLKVTVGLSPEALVGDALPQFPDADPKGPIIGVFFQLLMSIIGRFLSFGMNLSGESSDGDNRIVDVALDLSKPDVQRAYNKAMRGDWSQIEKLARDGHPGVDMERSIFTEITRKSVPFALNAFGFFFNRETAETLKDSDVVTDAGTYDVESDHDQSTQSTGGLFRNTSFTVSDFSRDVGLIAGELGTVKGEERWLSWQREHKDTFSSREEVVQQLKLARLLGDDGMRSSIDMYREKIGSIKERRKLWIGPRNEMRRTTVKTKVVISDAGLDELQGVSLDALWDAYTHNWLALHPGETKPLWASSAGRNYLNGHSDDLDVLLAQAEMLTVQNGLESMVRAAAIPDEEKRHDAIRKALFSDMGDESLVASVAQLAGKDHVKLTLDVDSASGDSGIENDLHLGLVGQGFDIQHQVFGDAI